MPADQTDVQAQLVKAGLEDPFIRAIGSVVVVAIAASTVISLLGAGMRAVIAIGLSIVFGVILVLMRVLVKNTDGAFVRWLCYIVSGTISIVFVLLIAFVVPAVVVCWPESYRDTLGLKACSAVVAHDEPAEPFRPIPYTGKGITLDPGNGKFTLLVFYRPGRLLDAEHVVGAFLTGGYASTGTASILNEVQTDDRSPDTTLVKTTSATQSLEPEVVRIVKLAIPVVADKVRTAPAPIPLVHGDVQVDLF